jgi:two-component system, sensor histidine kinase PdtaS
VTRNPSDPGLLATVFEAVGDLAFELDPSGVFLRFIGPREVLHAPPETFLGRSVEAVLPPDVARQLMEAIGRVRAGQGVLTVECALPLHNGRHHVEARMASSANGNIVVLVHQTEHRRQAEAELARHRKELGESEARFRTMADNAPVMLWMAGRDALCDFFNEGWLRFSGRTMEQELGNGWAEGVYPEDFQRCMDVYLTAFVERKAFAMEYRLRRADGEYRWIYDQGAPRYAPDGTFAGYIGSCVDITEQRKAQETLQRLNEELEARVRDRTVELTRRLNEREVLLREVHHRVRNNLQLVSSLLSMHARQIQNAGSRTMLEECQNRVETISLIHEWLYQSKDVSQISFAHYVRSLATNVFSAAGVSPASIALEVAIEDVAVSLDRAIPCGLILNELITNAVKHAFPDGRRGVVRIECRPADPGRLLLAVSDDGVGLPSDLAIRQSDSLGLRLIHALAEQIEAEIEVERTSGTSFRLTFGGRL